MPRSNWFGRVLLTAVMVTGPLWVRIEAGASVTRAGPESEPGLAVAAVDGFVPVASQRIYDSRDGDGPLARAEPRVVQAAGLLGVPSNAAAVVSTVTGIAPAAETFVSVLAANAERPAVSNLNLAAGQMRPNLVLTRLSPRRDCVV